MDLRGRRTIGPAATPPLSTGPAALLAGLIGACSTILRGLYLAEGDLRRARPARTLFAGVSGFGLVFFARWDRGQHKNFIFPDDGGSTALARDFDFTFYV